MRGNSVSLNNKVNFSAHALMSRVGDHNPEITFQPADDTAQVSTPGAGAVKRGPGTRMDQKV